MWWTEGPPHFLSMKGAPPPPVLCLRSGEIGLLINTKSVRLLHAGRFAAKQAKDTALEAGTKPLLALPAAELRMSVVWAGKTFTCTGRGPEPKDDFFQPVRFVESGRFFQRVVIEGLQFASADGTRLEAGGRLEIALWPDRLSLSLELGGHDTMREGELSIAAAGRRISASLAQSRRVTLPLFEGGPEGPPAQIEADPALAVSFDPALGCHVVALPEKPWSNAQGTYYPEEHLDRLDRWRLTLPQRRGARHGRAADVRAGAAPADHRFHADVVRPGWHAQRFTSPDFEELAPAPGEWPYCARGSWFHGCTIRCELPAKSRRDWCSRWSMRATAACRRFRTRSLCLIGWGHNQFWDEAAIGSFGESICYEPGRVQRRCFIDDMRPLMTLPVAGGKPWGWAENCGGGDFLVWFEERGEYRGFRATRADYRAQGPCRTDVRYQEETTGGEIKAQMEVSLVRSDDYVRAFHRLRYDVSLPVKWQRLAFFQLGADFYNDSPARRVAIGDLHGMREEWTPPHAQGAFDRRSVRLAGPQPWVSIHGLDRGALGKGSAAASRGLVIRSWRARLAGNPAPPRMSPPSAMSGAREIIRR